MARPGWRSALGAARVLASGNLSRYSGQQISITDRFEQELAAEFDTEHALAVSSGTSALVCALAGVGVGPGDEVLVPAYTWIASAAAPLLLGAVPILVDIDESLTMDPLDAAKKCTDRTKAMIPVHMNNLVCDMDALMAVAEDHELWVVEDACQAVGVRYRGQHVGTIGHVGALSFNQHKNITSGEGGAVLTDSAEIAARATMYHDVGSFTRGREMSPDVPVFVGTNAKMTDLSAAILRPQLRALDDLLSRRSRRRQQLVNAMQDAPSFPGRLAPSNGEAEPVSFVVQFDSSEAASDFATRRGAVRLIDTGRHVFTNWQPIQERRLHHPSVDPFQGRTDIDYSAEAYEQTLDILERSCSVNLTLSAPAPFYRALGRMLFR